MISYLTGTIKNLNEKSLTILTASGVGYKVWTPIRTLLSLTENANLEMKIHTVVKDDAIDLYGFVHDEEIEMFEKLITVNGIGPKGALNILSLTSVDTLASVIENGETNNLKIAGLGKKSMEKMVIELKGKLSHLTKNKSGNKNSEEQDARLALSSLGYADKDITNALNTVKENKNGFDLLQVNEIIKQALKELR